jgi:glycosyltransferase involved in cell wall biosynthesis
MKTVMNGERCRALFITDTTINGLASTTHIEITRALRQLGLEIEPVFFRYDNETAQHDLSPMFLIRHKDFSYAASIRVYLELYRIIARNHARYDYIIVEPTSALFLVPLAMLGRFLPRFPKIILDVRTQPVEVPDNWRGVVTRKKFAVTIKAAARFFNGFLAITDEMVKYLRQIAPIARPVGVWTSGVDLELFDPDKPYEPNPLFKGRFVVMYHGVFTPTRGLDRIILAIDEMRKEFPEVLLFFLGRGPMREKMREMVRERGLTEHVVIHDPVPKEAIPSYVNGADAGILAFPDHEWWSVQSPLKLFEYLAMAKPVIATDIPMNRGVVGGSEAAILIADNSVEQICNGIRKAMEQRKRLSEMGRIGRKIVEEKYSWAYQAQRIVEYLQTV